MQPPYLQLRGICYEGKNYILHSDLFIFLARIGELPNLNDSQRNLIDAIIKDLRANPAKLMTWES